MLEDGDLERFELGSDRGQFGVEGALAAGEGGEAAQLVAGGAGGGDGLRGRGGLLALGQEGVTDSSLRATRGQCCRTA